MATVAQVAKASLQRILVQASESDLEPSELQDYIFALNNFMLDLDASGVTLGYTVVSSLGDEVTVPTGALRGIIALVAIEVSPDYGGEVTAGLQKAAIEGMRTLRRLGRNIPVSRYPGTLPIGRSKQDCFGGSKFFDESESAILAETTGSISLETNTAESS